MKNIIKILILSFLFIGCKGKKREIEDPRDPHKPPLTVYMHYPRDKAPPNSIYFTGKGLLSIKYFKGEQYKYATTFQDTLYYNIYSDSLHVAFITINIIYWQFEHQAIRVKQNGKNEYKFQVEDKGLKINGYVKLIGDDSIEYKEDYADTIEMSGKYNVENIFSVYFVGKKTTIKNVESGTPSSDNTSKQDTIKISNLVNGAR